MEARPASETSGIFCDLDRDQFQMQYPFNKSINIKNL